jgi:hypothetical protein
MRLSKLKKLDPSAIDKCNMVFVLPFAMKKEEIKAFFNTIAHLTNARIIYSDSYQCRMIDDNQKMFILHLAIDIDFFHSMFVNPCIM